MAVYQAPEGYESFEAIEKLFNEKLEKPFTVVKSVKGGKMPMFTSGKMVGEIRVRHNSYNGVIITLTSTDGKLNDFITSTTYIPSPVVSFLYHKVLGYLTNLVFPAIYGSNEKVYQAVDDIIMKNLKVNELDTSVTGSLKSMFKGQGLGVRRSSESAEANEETEKE